MHFQWSEGRRRAHLISRLVFAVETDAFRNPQVQQLALVCQIWRVLVQFLLLDLSDGAAEAAAFRRLGLDRDAGRFYQSAIELLLLLLLQLFHLNRVYTVNNCLLTL